jgi:predicted nucleotidyltransferase
MRQRTRIGDKAQPNRCYSTFGTIMESPIERNLDEIARLCRRYQVRRLAVFGSILRGDFDPLRSDADFLVEFEPVPVAVRMQNYLGLREALASLLSRPVDLIEDGTIQNPYILQSVSEQQQVLYAA